MELKKIRRKPPWLNKRIDFSKCSNVKNILRGLSLHSVCEEAKCPNIGECFGNNTATFMILGSICTRDCRFCAIDKSREPLLPDPNEAVNLARAVERLNLKYVVITSVTRDDLPDYGAGRFVECIKQIRKKKKDIPVEILIPDFLGKRSFIEKIVLARPSVVNHNIETVQRLYPLARPKSDYRRSLSVLKIIKEIDPRMPTKSGLMVGLGEREDELTQTFSDLRRAGCSFLSIGQYLAPSLKHYPVEQYRTPEDFRRYKQTALAQGFIHVESSVYTRSSYNACAYLESQRMVSISKNKKFLVINHI